jgi:hypothetical protein
MSNFSWNVPRSVRAEPVRLCSDCDYGNCSTGCCKVSGNTDESITCKGCGHMKGSELCCKPYQTICEICGLVKDSAGCYKVQTE